MAQGSNNSMFRNAGRLTVSVLKRELSKSGIWLVCLTMLTLVGPIELKGLYDLKALSSFTTIMRIPAMVAMLGPVFIKDTTPATYAILGTNEMLLITLLLVAIMNIFYVVRQTRKEEESGSLEIVRSLPVGRLSNLASTLIGAVIINAIVSLFTFAALALLHGMDASFTLAGAAVYGLAFFVTGLVFAGIAGIVAQMASTSRGANTIGMAIVAVFYVIRIFGDFAISGSANTSLKFMSYLSPLGLALQGQPYIKNVVWPYAILFAVAIVLVVIAFALAQRRDLDAGLIPERPGKEHAPAYLTSNFGLIWRLMKNQLIGWAIVMVAVGATYGSILGVIGPFIQSSPFFRSIFKPIAGFSVAQVFIALLMVVFALVACVPSMLIVLKLRNEEFNGHLDYMLSAPVKRIRVIAGYLVYALITSVVMVAIAAAALWLTALIVLKGTGMKDLWLYTKMIAIYLPAIWAMTGFTTMLVGGVPQNTIGAWSYLAVGFYATYLGRVFLSNNAHWKWVIKVSPFGWIPEYPIDKVHPWTLVILVAIGVVLMAYGVYAFLQRDLEIG
ncbi:MAG: ABC transporter permease subunit [Coriobacteriia bacterium]|nr:ABC transporter permease subunit [Coriobacteriia bacterium]